MLIRWKYVLAVLAIPVLPMTAQATEWGFTESINNMTGKTIAALHSEDTAFGNGLAVVRIKCRAGEYEFQISTDKFLSTGSKKVLIRLDDNEVQSFMMNTSTRFQDVGLWDDSNARPFIEKFFESDRLRVQITPFGENPHFADFDLRGVKQYREIVDPCD